MFNNIIYKLLNTIKPLHKKNENYIQCLIIFNIHLSSIVLKKCYIIFFYFFFVKKNEIFKKKLSQVKILGSVFVCFYYRASQFVFNLITLFIHFKNIFHSNTLYLSKLILISFTDFFLIFHYKEFNKEINKGIIH